MPVPTKEELRELAAKVRQLEDEKDQAWNMRDTSQDAFLNHAIIQRRWAMASNHLGERIRDYIESGAVEGVRS